MPRLFEGNTVDVDDFYQNSVDYEDAKIQWALNEGFRQCELCNHWFENEEEINSHICTD